MAIQFKIIVINKTKKTFPFTNIISIVTFCLNFKTDILNTLNMTSNVFLPLNSTFAVCSLLSEHFGPFLANAMFKITLESIACFH